MRLYARINDFYGLKELLWYNENSIDHISYELYKFGKNATVSLYKGDDDLIIEFEDGVDINNLQCFIKLFGIKINGFRINSELIEFNKRLSKLRKTKKLIKELNK